MYSDGIGFGLVLICLANLGLLLDHKRKWLSSDGKAAISVGIVAASVMIICGIGYQTYRFNGDQKSITEAIRNISSEKDTLKARMAAHQVLVKKNAGAVRDIAQQANSSNGVPLTKAMEDARAERAAAVSHETHVLHQQGKTIARDRQFLQAKLDALRVNINKTVSTRAFIGLITLLSALALAILAALARLMHARRLLLIS